MIEKIIDFLKIQSGEDENCNINYKPYLYGTLVESLPFIKVVEMIEKDYIEMLDLINDNNVDIIKLQNSVLKMYIPHIVKF